MDVAEVHAKMDEYDIPFDSIWLDIEHTNGKRYFTWDSDVSCLPSSPLWSPFKKFPNPKEMAKKLEDQGRYIVSIFGISIDWYTFPGDDHRPPRQKGRELWPVQIGQR